MKQHKVKIKHNEWFADVELPITIDEWNEIKSLNIEVGDNLIIDGDKINVTFKFKNS